MILVKKSSLYILLTLVCILLVLGELRFFLALRSVNLATNLNLKYEIESFIFAAVVLTLIAYLFLVHFMRRSRNVIKSLDKMIELSEYGKYDIGSHLKKLDTLGGKIDYLLSYHKELNRMKSLRISSLSAIMALLIEKNREPIFLLNRLGTIEDCSAELLSTLQIEKEAIVGKSFDDLFRNIRYEELFFDIENNPRGIGKESLEVEAKGKVTRCSAVFYPVANADQTISHIVCVLEKK